MRMKFFKDNAPLIGRLFVNQVGMTIFGLVLSMAAQSKKTILFWISIFAVCFYLCLIYSVMWEEGAKDAIRIEQGRKRKDFLFPLKAAGFAAIPNFFAAFLMLFAFLFGYGFASFGWAQSFYAVMHIIVGLFQAMYVGIFSAILTPLAGNTVLYAGIGVVLYAISSLPMILMAIFAYWMGFCNKRVFSFRVPGKKKDR